MKASFWNLKDHPPLLTQLPPSFPQSHCLGAWLWGASHSNPHGKKSSQTYCQEKYREISKKSNLAPIISEGLSTGWIPGWKQRCRKLGEPEACLDLLKLNSWMELTRNTTGVQETEKELEQKPEDKTRGIYQKLVHAILLPGVATMFHMKKASWLMTICRHEDT